MLSSFTHQRCLQAIQRFTLLGYWNFIPHYRDIEGSVEELDIISVRDSKDTGVPFSVEKYEFRDEANRKWYSFFDEYEYRFNKDQREQKTWFGWFDKNASTAEKKLLTKLDLKIVTFTIMGFWSEMLNSSNIGNAYVSGMAESLNMKGNDLSTAVSLYNAGCVIFQVIYMYLFPRVPLHYLFFLVEIYSGVSQL